MSRVFSKREFFGNKGSRRFINLLVLTAMSKYLILVVDDEREFLSQVEEILRGEGHEILTALNGKEAIEKLKKTSNVSVILSDERMPEMTGNEFIQQAKDISPNTTRVMVTAYPNIETMEKAINKGEVYRFLTKPIDIEELIKVVMGGIQYYEKQKQNAQAQTLFNIALKKLKKQTKEIEKVRKEKAAFREKAIPIITTATRRIDKLKDQIHEKDEIATKSIDKLKDQIHEKDKIIKTLKDVSEEKEIASEGPRKSIVDSPEVLNEISQIKIKSGELKRDIDRGLNIKKELNTEISRLAEELEVYKQEHGADSEAPQFMDLFEVRQCLLNAQTTHEQNLNEQDILIASLERVLYENIFSEQEPSLSYETGTEVKALLDGILKEKETAVREIEKFRNLDLYLSRDLLQKDDSESVSDYKTSSDAELLGSQQDSSDDGESFFVPFSDMMTILFAFFVLVFAMSEIDITKFKKFFAAFQGKEIPETKTNVALTATELEMMTRIKELIKDNVDPNTIIRGDVINIRLDSQLLYDPGSAELLEDAKSMIIEAIKPNISGIKQFIVEGHTDDVPIHTDKFPSNWELSSARAASVARYIMEYFNLPPMYVKVIGYGSSRPLVPNDSDVNRRANRRVDIILSKSKESVRTGKQKTTKP